MEQKTLSELPFKDLYVRVDEMADEDAESRYNPLPTPGKSTYPNFVVPQEYDVDMNALRVRLRASKHDDFAITHDGVRLRVARYPTASDQTWAAMRRFPRELPNLDSLNFNPDDLQTMRSFGTRTGLIVIGGATGAGKTTTAVGLLAEFLTKQGGVLFTVEDPVEYMMQGPFIFNPDNAFVIQREIHDDNEWATSIKKALRSAPKYIFMGEVRTPAAAEQLLRAANSGHLVICTLHGGSVEQTLSGIIQIAQASLGDLATTFLADGLCAVIHQQIINGRVFLKMVSTEEKSASDPVRQNIRNNKLQMLGTTIEAQEVKRAGVSGAPAPVLPKPPQAASSSGQHPQRPQQQPQQQKKKGFW